LVIFHFLDFINYDGPNIPADDAGRGSRSGILSLRGMERRILMILKENYARDMRDLLILSMERDLLMWSSKLSSHQ
jgi:hypothetical protein